MEWRTLTVCFQISSNEMNSPLIKSNGRSRNRRNGRSYMT